MARSSCLDNPIPVCRGRKPASARGRLPENAHPGPSSSVHTAGLRASTCEPTLPQPRGQAHCAPTWPAPSFGCCYPELQRRATKTLQPTLEHTATQRTSHGPAPTQASCTSLDSRTFPVIQVVHAHGISNTSSNWQDDRVCLHCRGKSRVREEHTPSAAPPGPGDLGDLGPDPPGPGGTAEGECSAPTPAADPERSRHSFCPRKDLSVGGVLLQVPCPPLLN